MTTERAKWWKAFLPKWKPGGPKEPSSTQTFDPDFDPFAQKPEGKKEPSSVSSGDQSKQSQHQPNNTSGPFCDDTYDDTHLDSVFNERSCRRNMKVSRSGRFKEKRKAHISLPIQGKDTENWEDVR